MGSHTQPFDLNNCTVEQALYLQLAFDEHLKYVTLLANYGAYYTIFPVVRLSDGKNPWPTNMGSPGLNQTVRILSNLRISATPRKTGNSQVFCLTSKLSVTR